MRKIDVWATWTWDCPICDASNYVPYDKANKGFNYAKCRNCGRDFEIEAYIGKVIRGKGG